jgi:hypothetical protein
MIQSIAFVITLAIAVYFIRKRVLRLRDNIRLGKETTITGDKGQRLKNMILVAFGQQKMFKKITPAIFHFFIYAGFLIINLEVLEFITAFSLHFWVAYTLF